MELNCGCFLFDSAENRVQFGGLVSTSNTYAGERLTIVTDGLLYWSMGLRDEINEGGGGGGGGGSDEV